MKFLFFGTGKIANDIMSNIIMPNSQIEIVGFCDNDISKQNQSFWGFNVYSVQDALKLEIDYVCILLGEKYSDVYHQLVDEYDVEESKVVDRFFLLKQLMIEKYRNDNREYIKQTLLFWQEHDISFMNQFQYEKESYEKLFWDDENNMPYIMLNGKRLYYPSNYSNIFVVNNEKYVISYRNMEQHEKSPHRYIKGEICIHPNDIVVDAGAREGDFALPYIDIIKKLYLIECDPDWVQALKMTYQPYKDKVVIIPKMLSNMQNQEMTTLDNVLNGEKVNFLKMDIEGAEINALNAAKEALKSNDIRCAICSYHNSADEKGIIDILEKNAFRCSVSDGYVVYLYDPHIYRDLDFRKAIVYAIK